VHQGWRSDAVKEALDLCLSCKGCKGECPVKVDMATYKAEFLSHYYEHKARPLAAHVFGRIDRVSRFASKLPKVANFFSRSAPFSRITKSILGVASEREMPPFADESFTQWLAHRKSGNRPLSASTDSQTVILWPDTFNNFYHPETAKAALAVLERAGYDVHVPSTHVCCGRPLYEWGMLDQARAYLTHILDVMREDIEAGTPIVVLEPACASVFRDELGNLLANNEQAKRLGKQVFLLSEFVMRNESRFALPRLPKKAVVHAHCHHKAVLKTGAYEQVLQKLGLDYDLLDSGCCGMAGSFGFEKSKYDVSIRCAERVLLPAVRHANAETLVMANGFSCREQIRQTSGRNALHLADVMQLACTNA
jgi:Fe-S oxidoreductase